VSAVFPFRTNRYVVAELVDRARVPDDPISRLHVLFWLAFRRDGVFLADLGLAERGTTGLTAGRR